MLGKTSINLKLIILIILVSMGLFFLGRTLFAQYRVEGPIVEGITSLNEVREVEIGNNQELKIKLNKNIEFKQTYSKIEEEIAKQTELDSYQINIISQSNDILNKAKQELEFIIYTGLANQEYQTMRKDILTWQENEFNGQIQLAIGEEKLYLTMIYDEHYLFKTYQRKENRIEQIGEYYPGGENDG